MKPTLYLLLSTTLGSSLLVSPLLAADQNTARFLSNADFASGAQAPDAWKLSGQSDTLKLSRDTTDFRSDPASLRVEALAPAKGDLQSNLFASLPKGDFTVSGFYKLSGTWKQAQFAVQSLNSKANWGGVDWKVVSDLAPAPTWTPFKAQLSLAAPADTGLIHVLLEGQGTLQLDDLKIETTDAPVYNPAADAKPVGTQTSSYKGTDLLNWKQVFVGGGGTVTYATQNPAFPDELWAAMDVGGPMRYNRRTEAWVPMADIWGPDNTALLHTELIALDPHDRNHILYSAGKEWQTGAPSIVRSQDGGKTWTAAPLKSRKGEAAYISNGRTGERLVIDPHDGRIAFYGSRKNGLFKSSDGGATWSQVELPSAGATMDGVSVSFVQFDPTSGQDGQPTPTLYLHAAASDKNTTFPGGFYKSTDAGQSWQLLPSPPKNLWLGRVSRQGHLFAYGDGLFEWDGATWRDLTPARRTRPFEAFVISPTDPNIMLVGENQCGGGNAIYRTLDGGKTWTRFSDDDAFGRGAKLVDSQVQPWEGGNNGAHVFACLSSMNFDAVDPKKVWFTHWPGVGTITDVTAPVLQTRPSVKGHEEICVFEMASLPQGLPLVSGSMDVGGLIHPRLDQMPPSMMVGIKTPYNNAPEDITDIDFCEANPSFLAVAGGWKYQDWSNNPKNGATGFSADGGKTWQNFATSPFPEARDGRIAVNAKNPDNIVWIPRDTLGGTDKGNTPVYFSRDRGQTWTPAKGAPLGLIYGEFVYTFYQPLETDRVSGDFYIYDRRDGRFYRSQDGGENWTHIATIPRQAGAHFDRHWVRAAPGQAGEVWVAADEQGLLRSSDGGTTWAKLDGVTKAWAFGWGTPMKGSTTPVAFLLGKVKGDPTPQAVAMYRSQDMGKSWQRLNDPAQGWGQGIVVIGDRQTPGRAYVGTNGRGIFYADSN